MEQLKIFCFGTLNITKNGQVIRQFDTDKARALLVYLVLEHDRRLTRSHVAGMLWSQLSEKQALQSLRQTLLILKKAIGDFSSKPFVMSEKDVLFINPEIPVWVDVFAFQQEFSFAFQFFQRQDQFHRINFRQLVKAINLKKGTFLENFSITGAYLFDEWISLTREGLDHQAVEGLNLLVQYYQNRGEYGLARQTLQKILQITPWNEPAHLMLMKIYAHEGQYSALENQYRLLRKFLKNELDVEPAADTVSFYEDVRNHRVKVQIINKFDSKQTNIADKAFGFLGREKELDEITNLLVDPACRLITLHGPGGIGKTSLAQEIARQQIGIYCDGVFFISLAGASSCEELITELIEVLHVPLLESIPPANRLVDYLRNKTMLLVLDNFEQLLVTSETKHLLGSIIQYSTKIKFLVTSRDRLNLSEEWVYPVKGMDYPDQPNLVTIESAQKFDALALFQQRALQVNPEFKLDPNSISAVIQICRLYEGMPLAIELAAADVWSQSCQLIAENISHNLNCLRSDTSNVTLKQSSLWSNLDDSWNLMDGNLQTSFIKTGIFEDGFSSRAAKYIIFCEQDVLTRLVNRSLLQINPDSRYRAHNVIKQYAREKLQQSGMLGEVQMAFVDYYSQYLQKRWVEASTNHQKQMLDEIQIELKNLKKAWKLIIELKQTEKLEVFIETLYQFFNIRSRYQEGIELFQLAIIFMNQLQVEKAIDHYEILEGKVLVRIGSLAHRVRENGLARKSLEKAKLIFSKHSLDKELTDCQAALAEVYLRSNEYAAAEQTGHKILGFYQKSNDMIGQIKALNTLGLVSLRRGDIEVARRYLHQSVALGRKSENQRQLIVPLNYLGDIACNEGDYSEATYLFEESLKIASELEDLYQVALLLNNLASVYHVELDYPKAIEMYRKSLEICRQIGDLNGEAIALANLGEVALAQENYSGAITLSNQALSISREIGEEWSVSICLNNLAEAYCKIGQIDKAMRQIKEAIQIAYKNEATRFLARFMVTAGRCYQLQGMLDQAKDLLFAALGYSGIEFDIREKAIVSCKEMEIEELPEEDDEKLADVVRRYFGIEN